MSVEDIINLSTKAVQTHCLWFSVPEARGHELINVQGGRNETPHPLGAKADDFDFGCGERGRRLARALGCESCKSHRTPASASGDGWRRREQGFLWVVWGFT